MFVFECLSVSECACFRVCVCVRPWGHLQGASLVVLGVDPGSQSELRDEDLGCLGEQHRSLSADHLDTGHHSWVSLTHRNPLPPTASSDTITEGTLIGRIIIIS